MTYFLTNHMDTPSYTSCHLAVTLLSSRTTCGSSGQYNYTQSPACHTGALPFMLLSHPSICCRHSIQAASSWPSEPSKLHEELLKEAAGSRGAIPTDPLASLFCSSQYFYSSERGKTNTTFKSFRFHLLLFYSTLLPWASLRELLLKWINAHSVNWTLRVPEESI